MKEERTKNEIKHFSKLRHIWWGAKTHAGQKRYDNRFMLFKKYCHPKKGTLILEIGCGDGEFTKRLAKLESRTIGTDITPKVISRARKYFPKTKYKNVSFKIDNSEKMTFAPETFDVVCGISILHHIDAEKSLSESYRVLKRGGKIFFSEPNLLNPNIILGHNILCLRKKMEFSPDETALVRWHVEKMLKSIGFKKVKVVNYDFLHPKTPKYMINSVEKIGGTLEKLPLIKEISGSLIIYAQK